MKLIALLAEFIGTFVFVFIGIGAIAAEYITGWKMGVFGVAFAHGLALAVMISATSAFSGGHLNPAVTLGLLCAGKIDRINAAGYVVAQCLGAIMAASLIRLAMPLAALEAVMMGTPMLGEGMTVMMGIITEIILTFVLVFVIYGVAVNKTAQQPLSALFIGLTVTAGILMGGPISGAAMNPARYLGPALLGGGLSHMWLYWLGPLIGGIAAALLYKKMTLLFPNHESNT